MCCYLGVRTKRADGGHSDEGKAFIQVLVGGAALQECKGDKVELPFQNQDQLPVPAHGAAGVHQALQGENKSGLRVGGHADHHPGCHGRAGCGCWACNPVQVLTGTAPDSEGEASVLGSRQSVKVCERLRRGGEERHQSEEE